MQKIIHITTSASFECFKWMYLQVVGLLKLGIQLGHVIELNQHYSKVTELVSDKMPGIKKAEGTHKYNKVNQQKKYHLLNLFYKQSMPLREAAEVAGINYLTAKTIVFFHKNNHKSYQFDLQGPSTHTREAKNLSTAFYATLKKKNPVQEKLHYQKSRIEVVCSIGNVLNPRKNDNQGSSDLKHNLENMPSRFKSEQVLQKTQKYSYEARDSNDKTPSPTLHIQEEPQFDVFNLNLGLATKVDLASVTLLNGEEMIKSLLPSIQALKQK